AAGALADEGRQEERRDRHREAGGRSGPGEQGQGGHQRGGETHRRLDRKARREEVLAAFPPPARPPHGGRAGSFPRGRITKNCFSFFRGPAMLPRVRKEPARTEGKAPREAKASA